MTSFLERERPPEPMEALTHTVISPANVAFDMRISRARPLGRLALFKMRLRLAWLGWRIARSGRGESLTEYLELQTSLKSLLDYKYQLAQERQDNKGEKYLDMMWEELRQELEPKQARYKLLQNKLADSEVLAQEFDRLQQQLEDNPRVLARARIELDRMNKNRAESKNYEQILQNRWTQMGYCYRYTDKQGNKKVEEVGFSERHITPEAIYLKIGISEAAWLGGMTTKIPYGVRVADLVKPETLEELSLACQRQVSAKVNYIRGTWIIVNRLDTTDGLLNQVKYSEVMQAYPVKVHPRVPICVGVAERKRVQWLNLTDYPHGLIAGFTGSGKSNFVNAVVCTLITKHNPRLMRLILVDLKEGVEFSMFAGIPHLYGPIVESVPDLANKLEEVQAIMLERYKDMKGKAQNITQFNIKQPSVPMSRIVVVIDEVISTMDSGDYTNRILSSLKQLTAKGRAAGIHVILSTQRPSVDAIPGLIKVNLSFRIVGRMPSHTDSLTVLGSGAAKELPDIPGRMVMQLGPDPVPVQTPMIEDSDVDEALRIAMSYERPEAIPIPEGAYTQTEWSPERIVALSLNHLGGNISHIKVWEEIKEDGSLSRGQTRLLCERIWSMDCVEFEGKQYQVVKGRGAARKLVEIDSEVAQDLKIADSSHVTLEAI